MDYCFEQKLLEEGHTHVVGVDEAGRGPMAGPIVVGAVIFDQSIVSQTGFLAELKNSKALSEKKRESLYDIIMELAFAWNIYEIDNQQIDTLGIGVANKQAAVQAVMGLEVLPTYIACDYIAGLQFDTPYAILKKGDEKVASIAAASILAKVYRDRLMHEYHQKYPQYGFAQHKGYGTASHKQAIQEYGLCPIHRTSFKFK